MAGALGILAHLSAVSAEFLAKSERCGILCVCPADLDDVCKVFGLCIKRSLQRSRTAGSVRESPTDQDCSSAGKSRAKQEVTTMELFLIHCLTLHELLLKLPLEATASWVRHHTCLWHANHVVYK